MEKIKGYPRYYITRCGKVYSSFSGRYLKPIKQSHGYLQVHLSCNGKSKAFYVHRLVAITYLENLKDKPQINHKDGNKANNDTRNLEWVTSSENIKHAFDNKLNNVKGEKHSNHRLKNKDVFEIKSLLKDGFLQKDIAEVYGVGRKCVNDINTGKSWRHLR